MNVFCDFLILLIVKTSKSYNKKSIITYSQNYAAREVLSLFLKNAVIRKNMEQSQKQRTI